MLNAVCIGDQVGFRTRFAHSKPNVSVEVHVEQKRTAVEPVVMSTSCCFEGCDIQILLESFAIILVANIGHGWSFARPYSSVGVVVDAMGFSRLYSTVSFQVICV